MILHTSNNHDLSGIAVHGIFQRQIISEGAY